MPTYWGTNDDDSGRDRCEASAAVKRSAMWGAVVKVTLLTLGLAASYYGSVATFRSLLYKASKLLLRRFPRSRLAYHSRLDQRSRRSPPRLGILGL